MLVSHHTRQGRPALYNLCLELIWPEVVRRVQTHPHELSWRDPRNGGTALHCSVRSNAAVSCVHTMLQYSQNALTIQDKTGSTPLHIACWTNGRLATSLVEANPEAARIRDNSDRLPLHVACWSCPCPSVDVLRALIQAGGQESALARDRDGHTPLALLCMRHETRLQQAILAVDEGKMSESEIYSTILGPVWSQMCLLMECMLDTTPTVGVSASSRLVHLLASVPDCPHLLFQMGLKLYPNSVRERVRGSLPLHLACECRVSVDNDEHQRDGYYITTLLSLYPRSLRTRDGSNRLPFHIAVESGKSWEGVLQGLFQLYPAAIQQRDGKYRMLPAMIAALPLAGTDEPECDRMEIDGEKEESVEHLQRVNSLYELLLADPTAVGPVHR